MKTKITSICLCLATLAAPYLSKASVEVNLGTTKINLVQDLRKLDLRDKSVAAKKSSLQLISNYINKNREALGLGKEGEISFKASHAS